MNKDSRLARWARNRQKKLEISEGMSTGFKHRAAYHREFTGFSEIRIPTENGRYRIERVYVAPWYRADISDRNWIILKILYGILSAAALALFITASLQDTVWNYSRVTGALQCLASISMIVYAVRVIIFLVVPRNMTIGQCNSIDQPLKRWALFSFLTSAALMLWNVFLLIRQTESQSFFSGSSTLWMLIPVVIIFCTIWIIHRKLVYVPVENSNAVDEEQESYVIK